MTPGTGAERKERAQRPTAPSGGAERGRCAAVGGSRTLQTTRNESAGAIPEGDEVAAPRPSELCERSAAWSSQRDSALLRRKAATD